MKRACDCCTSERARAARPEKSSEPRSGGLCWCTHSMMLGCCWCRHHRCILRMCRIHAYTALGNDTADIWHARCSCSCCCCCIVIIKNAPAARFQEPHLARKAQIFWASARAILKNARCKFFSERGWINNNLSGTLFWIFCCARWCRAGLLMLKRRVEIRFWHGERAQEMEVTCCSWKKNQSFKF